MAELRTGCAAAGLARVSTVLATGNLIFATELPEAEIHQILTGVIGAHGLQNEAFLRVPAALRQVLLENPFPEAVRERPNHMLVLFMANAPSREEITAVESLDMPERVVVRGREAYIDYVNGVGGSKLTAARLERLLGRSGTARNWNTIGKLAERAAG